MKHKNAPSVLEFIKFLSVTVLVFRIPSKDLNTNRLFWALDFLVY